MTISSCSFIGKRFEEDILKENNINPLPKTKNTFCKFSPPVSLISESVESQYTFKQFLKNLPDNIKLSFIEKNIIWSFIQMNFRPDLSAPTSKLQVVLHYNEQDYYFNSFASEDSKYPYLQLLNYLTQKFKTRRSLTALAKLYDKYVPSQFYVSSNYQQFLSANKDSISKLPILKKQLFRGDETLREGERLPKISITKLLRKLKNDIGKKYTAKSFLFSEAPTPKLNQKCNFEMSLYENSVFLIEKKQIIVNTWGLKAGVNVFMATSNQEFQNISPINNTIFLAGESNSRSAAICLLSNRNQKNSYTWLISSNSRDPGQHLHHLKQYGVEQINSLTELDKLLKFSRHQFFKQPVRLVIESRRSSEEQLQELLKFNIPIYNAKSLGKIWGYHAGSQGSSFVLDERSPGHISCK